MGCSDQSNYRPTEPKHLIDRYVLSYGGGVNSTALLIYLIKNKMPVHEVVFADTGNELPETYEYIEYFTDYISKHGLSLKIVKNRKGESLFDRCFRRKVIPSEVWRWCTRDFKIKPIHKFYKLLGGHIYQYIAIDYDEIRRMKDSKEPNITNLYPLIDAKIGRAECVKIIEAEGLKVPPKSGCDFCPFNNEERWNYIKEHHSERYIQIQKLNRNNKHYPKQSLFKQSPADECDGYCMT